MLFPTRFVLRSLEEPYRSRALRAGTTRYWSWLFAARDARHPLLGIYALMAEWRALTDPATEVDVAHIKLNWWHDEIRRLAAGSPLHPISRYLAQLPRAEMIDFAQLEATIDAAAAQAAGVPLERAADLEPHAGALYGIPLRVAARLACDHGDGAPGGCIDALAAAEYLARAIADYAREARSGRVPFAVDELLAAGIDNDDLTAADPPRRLATYLDGLRRKAAAHYSAAAAALPRGERPRYRHLMVLATLGVKRLTERTSPSHADFRLSDLYNAWNAARRAASAR